MSATIVVFLLLQLHSALSSMASYVRTTVFDSNFIQQDSRTGIENRVQCAVLCGSTDHCKSYAYTSSSTTCQLGTVLQGAGFNYTTDASISKEIYINTGFLSHLLLLGGKDPQSGLITHSTRSFDEYLWDERLTALPSFMNRPLPEPAAFGFAAVVSDVVIFCGGITSAGGQATNECRLLLQDRGHWKAGPAMADARANAAHYSDGTMVIVAGGVDGSGGARLNTAEKLVDGKWKPLSNIPTPTEGACLVRKHNDQLYLLGGRANPKQRLSYVLSTDTWTVLNVDLPFNLVNGACITVNLRDDCYVYGRIRPNYGIGTKFNVETPDDCQRHCQANPDCAFFAYNIQLQKCTQQSAALLENSPLQSSNGISGPRYCPTDCYAYGLRTWAVGNTFSIGGVSTGPDACRRECRKLTGCSYAFYLDAQCHHAPNTVDLNIFYKSDAIDNAVLVPDRCRLDCFSPDTTSPSATLVLHSNVATAVDCQNICQANSQCQAFVWDSADDSCNLKKKYTEWYSNPATGKVYGPKYCHGEADAGCRLRDTSPPDTDAFETVDVDGWDTCRDVCRNSEHCESAALDVANKKCRLFSKVKQMANRPARHLAHKHCSSRKMSLACVERDMNYEGNNVLGGSGYYSRYWNLKDCMRRCQMEYRCKYWSYDSLNKHCYMKNYKGLGNRMPTTKFYSGPAECDDSRYSGCVEYNVAYTGIVETSETQSPNVVDWFKCQYLCKRLKDCVAFLYNHADELCKKLASFTGKKVDPKFVSGKKDCTLHVECFDFDLRYHGGSLLATETSDYPQACQAKCKALDDCDHFIFHGVAKKCSLYSGQHTRAMAGGTAGQNYISGPKACADPVQSNINPRVLVVGGDSANQRLWVSNNWVNTFRKSAPLPYGTGQTVYNAVLAVRDQRVFLTGGFSDVDGQNAVPNGDKIYEYVVNSHFREVASDTTGFTVGGASAVFVPKVLDD